MATEDAAADALVHSSAVYLYLYDTASGQYAPQSESVVGCALLGSVAHAFKLLFYHSQTKQPILTAPVTTATRFTPQQNHYVNFYDATQKNYSMRFKDAVASTTFLRAVAFAKAQAFAEDGGNYRDNTRPRIVQYDDLEIGKESASGGVTLGDIVGLAWTSWQGLQATNAAFFTPNPLEIETKTPSEAIARDSELKRVVLGDVSGDDVSRALTEGIVGMHKHGRRIVTIVLPASQQWIIGELELVKIKKNKSGSASYHQAPAIAIPVSSSESSPALQDDEAAALENSPHGDLVTRMAALSRVGSKGTALMADLSARTSMASPEKGMRRMNSSGSFGSADSSRRSSSIDNAMQYPGMGPIPLHGIVSAPDSTKGSVSRRSSQQSMHAPSTTTAPEGRESVTAQVLSTAQHQSQDPVSYTPSPSFLQSSAFVSADADSLLKEQSELEELKKKLEESKRRLEQQHSDPQPPNTAASSSTPASSNYGSSSFSSALTVAASPLSNISPMPLATSSGLPNGFTPWQPSLPTPSTFPSSFSSTGLPPFGSSSLIPSPVPQQNPFSSKPHERSATGPTMSPELDNNIMRLQRSSNSIETTLHDLQSKMDRLLNLQSSGKSSKYVPMSSTSGLYTSSLGGGSTSSSISATTSSTSLLKNLEKALAQRDQLQELNARLQDHKEQMESTIEDLQNQHESLQHENRTLLEKLQNGSHMQQEKFRMEVRTVEQQLSHTQQQMMAYQDENLRLRQELAAKDELVVKEKAQVQDDARKQLEQLQRQLQVHVQQESKETLDRLQADKLRVENQLSELHAQKTQVETEKDSLANQVRMLQNQQSQWADEKAHVQSQQDSRAKELHAQLQQAGVDMATFKQQLEKYRSENRQLIEMVETKEQQMAQLQDAKTQQEYAALSELLKEFMNDIYFHFQDAFEEDAEYTGKEIVTAIRKILKQNTMEILSKLEEFWHQQHQSA